MGALVLLSAFPRAGAALLLALVACAAPEPFVEARVYAPPGAALTRVAVIPFYPHRSYEGSLLLGGVSGEVASERVTRFVAEALSERGVAVVPAEEVAAAIADLPRTTAAVDALVFCELAGRKLGATAVLTGEVVRFREPRGASPTARRPASVAYQVTLYEVPDGYKLWAARYDETQTVPPDDDSGEHQGVGFGQSWLSAGELARRGADAVARSLAESL